ncbi:DnaJ domain-containing protein [Desulfospira joergensenii]|uniref:DnaJ domain-containing protein n=1 Tax=Desulfospira joergensenii TaxID=53329 RepID=UPI0003B6C023|nr:DnaJ domain-containing protein [Desulfospira joergensenii]
MPKNHYLVLGVASDATSEDIKEAYRRLAKEFHPDHYGENHSPFLAIQEAYSVLSDPIKRQDHDLAVLGRGEKPGQFPRGKGVWPGSRRMAEPLIPGQGLSQDLRGVNSAESFYSYRSSMDRLFGRPPSRLNPMARPGRNQAKNLHLEVDLTLEQAFSGGQLRVALRGEFRCPSCTGAGRAAMGECPHCHGMGILPGETPVMIRWPPGVPDNHRIQMALNPSGMDNLTLTIHFRIKEMF